MYHYPIEIITGKGLGICYSSYKQIGPLWKSGNWGQINARYFYNITTGNVFIKNPPVQIIEMGKTFEIGFVYNSQQKNNPWYLSKKKFLNLPHPESHVSAITLKEEDGHETAYTYNPILGGCYQAPAFGNGRPFLRYDREKLIWIWFNPATGERELYDASGFRIEKSDLQGHKIKFTYKDDELEAVHMPSGDVYEIAPKDNTYTIARVTGTNRVILHRYDFGGRSNLKSTLNDEHTIEYFDALKSDDANNFILKLIKQSDGTKIEPYVNYIHGIAYLEYIGYGDYGSRMNFYYNAEDNTVKVRNFRFGWNIFKFDNQARISEHIQNSGIHPGFKEQDKTLYQYHDAGQLATTTFPDGSVERFEYQPHANPYIAFYELQSSHIRPNGEITNYYYEQGEYWYPFLMNLGRKLNNKSKEIYTRFAYEIAYKTYGGLFLRYVISPWGRITEYRPNEAGYLDSIREYTHIRFNHHELPQPNLFVGCGYVEDVLEEQHCHPQQVTLIKLDQDPYGMVARRRQFANITIEGEGVNDECASEEAFSYNHQGNFTSKTIKQKPDDKTNKPHASWNFDFLNRLKSVTDELEQEDIIDIDHAKLTITTRLHDGTIKVKKYSNQWRLVSSTHTAEVGQEVESREVVIKLDCERPVLVTHPDGQKSYPLYDMQLREIFNVSSNGKVIQHCFSRANRYEQLYQYSKLIDLDKVCDEDDITDAPGLLKILKADYLDLDNDRLTYEFFDEVERVRFEVDAELYVTETIYDIDGKIATKIQYANPITADLLEGWKNKNDLVLAVDPQRDRVWQYFRDEDGNLIGEKDPAGYVTEHKLNGAAHITQTIRYATPKQTYSATATLETARPIATVNDALTYFFCNAKGKITHEIDAEGYLTKYNYSPSDLLLEKIRFAKAVPADWFNNPSKETLDNFPSSCEDRYTQYDYDKKSREIFRRESTGKNTYTLYDKHGNVEYEIYLDQACLKDPASSKSTLSINDILLDKISDDTLRAKFEGFDGFKQLRAEANLSSQTLIELFKIDSNDQLSPEEKQNQKQKVWSKEATTYDYRNKGLKAVKEDSLGHKTLYFYNTARQLVLTIDPTGAVTERKPSVFDQPLETRIHCNRLTKEVFATLQGGLISPEIITLIQQNWNEKDSIEKCKYNKRGLLIEKTDAENFVTEYKHNAFNNVIEEKIPVKDNSEKMLIKHGFDARNNEVETIKSSKDGMIKSKKEFATYHNKPTTVTEADNTQTVTHYDKLGRAAEVHTPQGMHSYKHDAFDQVAQESDTYDNAITHEYNQTNRAHTIIAPDNEDFTQYTHNIFHEEISQSDALGNMHRQEHNAHGLITKIIDPLNNETATTYDTEKNVKSITKPSGLNIFIDYNEANQTTKKTSTYDGIKLEEQYEPTVLGQNKRVINAAGIITKNEFNKKGDLVESIVDAAENGLRIKTVLNCNAQGDVVETAIFDAKNKEAYRERYNIDGFGRSVGHVVDPVTDVTPKDVALELTTTISLDKCERTVSEKDIYGNTTFIFYNGMGKPQFSVQPDGALIEYTYNLVGLLVKEQCYTNKIDNSTISEASTLIDIGNLIKPSNTDSILYHFYDKNKRERFVVSLFDRDEKGSRATIKETCYAKNSQISANIQYAKLFSAEDFESYSFDDIVKITSETANDNNNRKTYFINDANKRPRFIVNSIGVVNEIRYDQSGNIIAKITYATPVKDIMGFSRLSEMAAAVATQIIRSPEKDRTAYSIYNARYQKIFSVDPESNVVAFDYDADGREILNCKFHNKVDTAQDYAALVNALIDKPYDLKQDRITRTKYDAAGRKKWIINALQQKESYEYDATNNQIELVDRKGNSWTTTFDRAKRPTAEIAPDKKSILRKYAYANSKHTVQITDAPDAAEERAITSEFDKKKRLSTRIHRGSLDPTVNDGIDVTLSQTLWNTKDLPLVKQTEAGHWEFYIYDNQHHPIYKITSNGAVIGYKYNAFGDPEQEIQYAHPLEINLDDYRQTGVSLDVLKKELKPSDEDIVIERRFDQAGKKLFEKRGNRILEQRVDAFGDVIKTRRLVDANSNTWSETLSWFDKNSKLAATLDSSKNLKRIYRNSFSDIEKHVAYKQSIKTKVSEQLSLSEIDALVEATPGKDIVNVTEHNLLGNEIAEKRLHVKLQSLTLDPVSNRYVVDDVEYDALIESYQYDANGNQICLSLNNGLKKYFYYNELNNQIGETGIPRESVDEQGNAITLIPLTFYEWNALNQKISKLHHAAGTVAPTLNLLPKSIAASARDQSTLLKSNKLDKPIGQTVDATGLNIDTKQKLNLAGQILVDMDAAGNVTYCYYDTSGQKRFEVNPIGGLSEWQYDAFGNIISEKIYENTIPGFSPVSSINSKFNTITLSEIEKISKEIASESDSYKRRFYDKNNKQRFELTYNYSDDAKTTYVSIVESYYNNAGHEIQQIGYASQWQASSLDNLSTNKLAFFLKDKATDKDRQEYKIYDEAGNVRFRINPAGYITQYWLDAFCNTTKTKAYATGVSRPEFLTALPWHQVEAKLITAPEDRAAYTIFNTFNKPEYEINAKGYVTRYAYDQQKNCIAEIKFAHAISIPDNDEALDKTVHALTVDLKRDRQITHQYDAANQRIATTNARGFTEKFRYDIFGNITHKTNPKNNTWKTRWDNANRPELETSPQHEITNVKFENGKLVYNKERLAVETVKEFTKNGKEKTVTVGSNTATERTIHMAQNRLNLEESRSFVTQIDDLSRSANLVSRPDTDTELSTRIVYNTKKQKIAEQAENGSWSFYVRDNLGNEIYKLIPLKKCDDSDTLYEYRVIKNEYNAFRDIDKTIQYENAIQLNPALYLVKGITVAQVKSVLVNPNDSRTENHKRNKLGKITSTRHDAILTCSATKEGKQDIGFLSPEEQFEYNAFGEVVRHASLISKDNWQEKLTWRDRAGNCVAQCDSVNTNSFLVTTAEFDAFQNAVRKTEFSTPIPHNLSYQMSHEALKKLIEANPSLDRTVATKYSLTGKPKTVTQVAVPQYQATRNSIGLPELQLIGYQDFSTTHEYDETDQCFSTTFEDGSVEYFYFNEIDKCIAIAEMTRENYEIQPDNTLKIIKQTPLTILGYDAHQNQVLTYRSALGTQPISNPKQLPVPISETDKDKLTLTLRNNRGLEVCSQDPENHLTLKSYNSNKKLVRRWAPKTSWSAAGTLVTYVDENRTTFDLQNRPTRTLVLRDNAIVNRDTKEQRLNVFGEVIAINLDGNWEVYKHRDKQGRVWLTNENKGTPTITLANLVGDETVKIQSAKKDLGTVAYAAVADILASPSPADEIEVTLTARNKQTQITAQFSPDALIPTMPLIPLQIQLHYENNKSFLQWDNPGLDDAKAKHMKFKLENASVFSYDFLINYQDDQAIVHISSLPPGNYQYEIDYEMDNSDHPTIYMTTGRLPYKTEAPVTSNSKEFTISAEIAIRDDETLLTLAGSEELLKKDILLTLNYKMDDQHTGNYVSDIIKYNPEKNGYVLHLPKNIKDVSALTLEIINDKQEKFVVYKQDRPVSQVAIESDYEFISLEDATQQHTLICFEEKHLLQVTHIPGLNPELNTITYYNAHGRQSSWRPAIVHSVVNESSFLLDVTDVPLGHYPFKVLGLSDELFIFDYTKGLDIYASDMLEENSKYITTKVSCYFVPDRWGNVISKINTLGYVTDTLFNQHNKPLKIEEPSVLVQLNNSSIQIRPTTLHTYTVRGVHISEMNSNGHQKQQIVNAAGQVLDEYLGSDPTPVMRHAIDALAREVGYVDGRGKCWRKILDRKDNVIALIKPSQKQITSVYNEDNSLITHTTAMNQQTRYGLDTSSNIVLRFEPNGSLFQMQHDRYGTVILKKYPGEDAPYETWITDAFGRVRQHRQFSTNQVTGALITYALNFKSEVTEEKAQGGLHGQYMPNTPALINDTLRELPSLFSSRITWLLWKNLCDNPLVPTPDRHLQYEMKHGRRVAIYDLAMNTKNYFVYDTEGHTTHSELWENGSLVRAQDSGFDAAGRECSAKDGDLSADFLFDPAGGHVNVHTEYKIPSQQILLVDNTKQQFDDVERLTSASATSGRKDNYEYKGNVRFRENGIEILRDDDGYVTGTQKDAAHPLTKRDLDADKRLTDFYDYPKNQHQSTRYYPSSNQVNSVESYENKKLKTKMVVKEFSAATGAPTLQHIEYDNKSDKYEDVRTLFINFESPEESEVNRISHIQGRGNSRATRNFDANGCTNSMIGLAAKEGRSKDMITHSTSDGRLLDQLVVPRMRRNCDNEEREYMVEFYKHIRNFYTASQKPLAALEFNHAQELNPNSTSIKFLSHYDTSQGGGVVKLPKLGAVLMTSLVNVASPVTSITDSLSDVPRSYTICKDDTYESISHKFFSSADYAADIAAANPHVVGVRFDSESEEDSLPAGETITIPQLAVSTNHAGRYKPYYDFSRTMYEALMPVLIIQQKHDHPDFFKTLVKVIAATAICIVAPEAAGLVLPAMMATGGAVAATAVGVTAAALDAAAQGLEIGIGVTDKFSASEMISTAFASGAAYFNGINLPQRTASAIAAAKSAAESTVGTQLMEMMIGTRHHFQFDQIIKAVAASYAMSFINLGRADDWQTQLTHNAMYTTANAGMNALLYHANPNLSEILAETMGTQIGQMTATPVAAHLHMMASEVKEKQFCNVAQKKSSGLSQPEMKKTKVQKHRATKATEPKKLQFHSYQLTKQSASSTKSILEKIMDHVEAFNSGVEATRDSLLHPIDTVIGIATTAWDGVNAMSELAFNVSTQGAHERNIQRGVAVNRGIDNFVHGDSVTRTRIISHGVSSVIVGSAVGVGSAASIAKFGKFTVGAVDPQASLNPSKIRNSQESISYLKSRPGKASYTLNDIIHSMQTNGWNGESIDVVKMPEGGYSTLDHTRVIAAKRAGIEVNVTIRRYNERLPSNMQTRFQHPMINNCFALTWGEALEYRIMKQSAQFQNRHYPIGTYDEPKINYPKIYL